jgi:FtsH-binding integral membrane protein
VPLSLVLLPLIGFVAAELLVMLSLYMSASFTSPRALLSSIAAILLVLLVASVLGYFCVRVRINDHYEFNLEILKVFFIYPAGGGALLGAIAGVYFARRRVFR